MRELPPPINKDEKNSPLVNFLRKIQQSATLKVFTILIITLLLLIPKSLVMDIIYERTDLQKNAIDEITSLWANEQQIKGPFLKIPYTYEVSETKDKKAYRKRAYFYVTPEEMSAYAKISIKYKHRGIYQVPIYTSDIDFKGIMDVKLLPDLEENSEIQFDKISLILGVSDAKGLTENIKIKINGKAVIMDSSSKIKDMDTFEVRLPETYIVNQKLPFNFNLKLKGTRSVAILPVGDQTKIKMEGNWADPKLFGGFASENINIKDGKFDADWSVIKLNRAFNSVLFPNQLEQLFSNKHKGSSNNKYNYRLIENFNNLDNMVAVEFLDTNDHYKKTIRATKYGVMVILVSFLVFFLIEMIAKLKIHPMQYILVGIAIVIFFLVLVALAEHISFDLAYLIASLTIICMNTIYATTIFKKKKYVGILCLGMVFSFTFIFITINLIDFALLFGAIGSLIALGITMFATRNIKWTQEE